MVKHLEKMLLIFYLTLTKDQQVIKINSHEFLQYIMEA